MKLSSKWTALSDSVGVDMIGWFLYPIIAATVFIILYKLNNGFKD